MFEVGFFELVLIGVVALLVIGPQRLPSVARTVGHLLGRLQRYVAQVKAEVRQQMRLEELQMLQEQMERTAQQTMQDLEKIARVSVSEDPLNNQEQANKDLKVTPSPVEKDIN
jgi:sec-independent protein translocase protein TatB